MDGNGRWAQQAGQPRTEGHRRGADAVRRTVEACRRLGIPALTLYAFSEQNWSRPPAEIASLMALLRDYLVAEHDDILRHRICLRAVGRTGRLPFFVRQVLDPLVRQSRAHDGMVLSLALSYGGREEIVDAVRHMAKQVAKGKLDPSHIDETMLASHLPSHAPGPVDLLIRTGGEKRLSNFMLWGAAYAELHFSSVMWPDFSETELHRAIIAYQQRERRFGAVGVDGAAHSSDPSRDSESSGNPRGMVLTPAALVTHA